MNNNNLLKNVNTFATLGYGLICLSIGIWEAQLLGLHGKPDNNRCNEIYGFGISKSVLNILFGVGYLLMSCLYYFTDYKENKENKQNNNFTLINTGVSIWGLVIVFNYLNDFNDCDYYKIIPIVEMYFFFICLGILALILLVMVCGCCFVCCTNKSNDTNTNKTIDVNTNVSVDSNKSTDMLTVV
jgi:hypothetical protein